MIDKASLIDKLETFQETINGFEILNPYASAEDHDKAVAELAIRFLKDFVPVASTLLELVADLPYFKARRGWIEALTEGLESGVAALESDWNEHKASLRGPE